MHNERANENTFQTVAVNIIEIFGVGKVSAGCRKKPTLQVRDETSIKWDACLV